MRSYSLYPELTLEDNSILSRKPPVRVITKLLEPAISCYGTPTTRRVMILMLSMILRTFLYRIEIYGNVLIFFFDRDIWFMRQFEKNKISSFINLHHC